MPIFGTPSLLKKYEPKNIKLSDLHKSGAAYRDLSGPAKQQVKDALKAAGLTDAKISEIVDYNKPLPLKTARTVSDFLAKNKVSGFNTDKPDYPIKKYVQKEAVKKRSIETLKHERMLEARMENLNSGTRPKISPKIKLNF